MFTETLGIIKVRQKNREYLFDVFSAISEICDDIIIIDDQNILTFDEEQMLMDKFSVFIFHGNITDNDLSGYNPQWIFTCYSDEMPSKRFNHMKISLTMNPYINVWMSTCQHLWGSEEYHRVDKNWASHQYPILYRYIPEVNYEWDDSLIPANQPGPRENCMVKMLSFRYIDDEHREEAFEDFLQHEDSVSPATREYYNSLLDIEITVQKVVD